MIDLNPESLRRAAEEYVRQHNPYGLTPEAAALLAKDSEFLLAPILRAFLAAEAEHSRREHVLLHAARNRYTAMWDAANKGSSDD